MSTEHGPQPERPMDPLLAAVTEGVATGYKALELVIEGLRESLRLQAGSPARPSSGRAAPGTLHRDAPPRLRSSLSSADHAKTPTGLVQDLAAIVSEALGLAGTLVDDVAAAISEQTHGSVDQECLPALTLGAPAGGTATTSFTVWNTGPTLLRDVRSSATDLIGDSFQIPASAATFDPSSVAALAPGSGQPVKISWSVPAEARPGVCRGIVVATPGDACAVLELTVAAPVQPVVGKPAKNARPVESS